VGVTADLDLSALDTGHRRRDKDLRSRRFFDTERHPTAHFESTQVREMAGPRSRLTTPACLDVAHAPDPRPAPAPSRWEVSGVLTIGGTRCPLTLHVRRGGDCYDGFIATAEVTKQDLGVRAPDFLIRPAITLTITTRLP